MTKLINSNKKNLQLWPPKLVRNNFFYYVNISTKFFITIRRIYHKKRISTTYLYVNFDHYSLFILHAFGLTKH